MRFINILKVNTAENGYWDLFAFTHSLLTLKHKIITYISYHIKQPRQYTIKLPIKIFKLHMYLKM